MADLPWSLGHCPQCLKRWANPAQNWVSLLICLYDMPKLDQPSVYRPLKLKGLQCPFCCAQFHPATHAVTREGVL